MNKLGILGLMSLFVSTTVMAGPIDMETARQLAKPYVVNGTEPNLVKAAARNEAKARNIDSATASTSPYYVFSRGENKGFVIVSGDDCLPEILGYTESGNFDESTLPPHLINWLNHYANLIEDAQAQGANISRQSKQRAVEPVERTATKADIAPLVTAHWHQSGPYNNYCPFITGTTNRAVTGCVATAAAQIAYYYRKDNPPTLLATTPTYGYGDAPVTVSYPAGTPIKWDLMLDDYNGSRPAEYDDAVATLNAALGAATWLTYGSSTSGQISDLVNTYNSYFRLSSTSIYKGGESQAAWENMIYNDLAKGHPIVYSGAHPTNGGHAVVLDGYKAATNLFHFNFGWGGQGDGWYTVDDETGMNGFNTYQGMVYKITPKELNISADISFWSEFYVNRTNECHVVIRNNGTLDFKGLYLFMSTSSSRPASLSSAKDEDLETLVTNDGSEVHVVLNCKPTLEKTYYLWVTDENLNVLAKDTFDAVLPTSDLQLDGMEVLASDAVEKFEDAEYSVVYNKEKATCRINVSNNGVIGFEGSPRLAVYGSKDSGKTFEYVGYKSAKLTVPAGESGSALINVTNSESCPIEAGVLYKGVLVNPISSAKTEDSLKYVNSDTIVRFVLRDESLVADSYENGCLKLSGDWDYNLFTTLSKKVAYRGATSYDLTNVRNIGSAPVCEANPNALFYVADEVAVDGCNIVRKSDMTCADLSLTVGYDFTPVSSIKVKNYSLNIAQEPGLWYLLTSPCEVTVPDGIIARHVDSHRSTGINNRTTNVTKLEAGKTYLVMTSSTRKQTLLGQDVECAATPCVNVDTAIVGTYLAVTPPEGAMLIDHVDEYFSPVDETMQAEALRGYFYDSSMSKRFRAYSSIAVDPKYMTLGNIIEQCYDVLEEYEDIVSEEAYAELSDSIANAEKVFSLMTLTTGNAVTMYGESLLALCEVYKQSLNAFNNPDETDCTQLIANPSFEVGSTAGWTVGDKTIAVARSASNLFYKGVGSDGNYLLYNLNSSDSTGVAISQTLTDVPAGVYRLSAKLGSDTGNAITMFAGEKKVTISGHTFGKYYLSEAVIDSITVGAEGTLTIGVEGGKWYKADDFRLVRLEADGVADAIVDEEIKDTERTLSVLPIGGGIAISSVKPVSVSIHSISGILLWHKTICGTVTVELPRGLYIVNNQKIVVK